MTADQEPSSGRVQQITLAIAALRRNLPGGSNAAIVDALDILARHADAAALGEVEEFLGSRLLWEHYGDRDDDPPDWHLDPQAFKLDLAPFIQYGASPRATLYLTLAAKAHAFISGRGYVTPQDVKSIGGDVLRHRITVSYEAEAEEMTSDTIVQRIFDGVPVP